VNSQFSAVVFTRWRLIRLAEKYGFSNSFFVFPVDGSVSYQLG